MPTCELKVHSATEGTLSITPLPRSAAETFGGRLRRAVLRRVPGARVSAVQVDGAKHEFARSDGVYEDMLAIVANLKHARVRLRGRAMALVKIDVQGPATVTAAALADGAGVSVARADHVIATVGDGVRLAMTVEIARPTGFGHRPNPRRRPAGWVEIDGDCHAIDRVAMAVTGSPAQATLSLTVWTNGTIGPAEALSQAAAWLELHADAPEPTPALCQAILTATASPTDQTIDRPARPKATTRELAKVRPDVSVGDLTELQKRSYAWFCQPGADPDSRRPQGIEQVLRGLFPSELPDDGPVEYAGYRIGQPRMDIDACTRFGRTYAGTVDLRLRRTGDGQRRTLTVCELPMMTPRGTFVIAGREKVVVGCLQAEEDTRHNDLATRRLLLVGRQLHAALVAADQNGDLGARLTAIAGATKDFFANGRLVRPAETTNPLSLTAQLRRVVQRAAAGRCGYDARGVHPSHFGRLCLLETPEGKSIGVNLNTAILARVDDDGRLVTPCRPIGGDRVEYLSPTDDAEHTLADLPGDSRYHARYGGGVLAKQGQDIVRIPPAAAEYVPVHPLQALGAPGSLIPLVAHDDANRALMGANMQKQAAPLLAPEAPRVQSGTERPVSDAAGMSVRAEIPGVVVTAGADAIVVQSDEGNRRRYSLSPVSGSSHGTCLRQRPRVRPGDAVTAGQLLADGPATDDGVLALGRNVLVGYLPWDGYNFEDGIVVSDRLVAEEVFTSIKARQFVVTVGTVDERFDPDGLVSEADAVSGGDVLVAKSRRIRNADGEDQWADASVRMPIGQRGTVTAVEHYAAEAGDPLANGVARLIRVTVAVRRPLTVGDKLANRHGAKGTVTRIVPAEEMPVLPDGRTLDVILDPLGVPSRLNIGQILETHLSLAAEALNCTVVTAGFGGASVADINAMLAEANLPASGQMRLRDGRTGRPFDGDTTVGYLYMMKLIHLAADRCQGRAVGDYAPDTAQPVGGRRHGGGQRIGIQETWALQAHQAAHTLGEMLTIKSDDVAARAKTYDALLAGNPPAEPTVPHSAKRMVTRLRGLGLDLRLFAAASDDEMDVFDPACSVEQAASSAIEFASADTVRRWSAGGFTPAGAEATFDQTFGADDGLTLRHIELAAPVKHPWRHLLGDHADAAGEITALPVLPRCLRGGRGLDRAYLAVAAASEAVANIETPEAVAALQREIDILFDGLTRLLHGKRGWVTAALSGKTVDYSGRAVASPGPDLRYDQCRLPRELAKRLFEPLAVGELIRADLAESTTQAAAMLAADHPAAIAALDAVAAERFVLLHRAPVLHRLGIQAFRPTITDEHVIRVHPLALRAFNADFDGDELDVYLPLSAAAQAEAARSIRSSACQLAPASGTYMNGPVQDMILGCYYATRRRQDPASVVGRFATPEAVSAAWERGEISIDETVLLGANGNTRAITVGRTLLNQLLPAGMDWIETPATGAVLRDLMAGCHRQFGDSAAARLGDALMRFGFRHATLAGVSLGKDDLRQSPRRAERLAETWARIDELDVQRRQGQISDQDRYWQKLNLWTRTTDELTVAGLTQLAEDRDGANPVHMMMDSGARGGRTQVRQLVSIRGLMTRPDGDILDLPVAATFVDGHSPMEYLISTFGARRGLADTSLKTSEAGFLFKRMINAVQDVMITEPDCGAGAGVLRTAVVQDEREIVPLAQRIAGRTAAGDISAPAADGTIVRRGELITPEAADAIAGAGIKAVAIRSPVMCQAKTGICAACYGVDLATWRLAAISLPAGVLAAQSLGEPMTQLTMRTFYQAVVVQREPGPRGGAKESILGGLPRLDHIFEAGRRPRHHDDNARQRLQEMLAGQDAAAVAEHLLAEIHQTYRRQGVRVDDKHAEVILRQMLDKLRVTDPGDTWLSTGELIPAAGLAVANAAATGRAATAEPAIVGITEAAACTADFLAAAAVYGGAAGLANAAARKMTMPLQGIRSRTILGKRIPSAGGQQA